MAQELDRQEIRPHRRGTSRRPRRPELAAAPRLSFISARMNLHLQLLLHMLAGWINRHQQSVIEYLQAENRALCEQLGPKRIRWTDEQRRRLAEKAKAVGRYALKQLSSIVTPNTLLRWYRQLVAARLRWLGQAWARPSSRQAFAQRACR